MGKMRHRVIDDGDHCLLYEEVLVGSGHVLEGAELELPWVLLWC